METNQKPRVYIDGQAGTTGLEIVSRLSPRDDLQLLLLEDDKRHDDAARKAMMDQADLIFLCLPDAAAIEAARWIGEDKKVIDTSTAHRTKWTYGFSELSPSLKSEIEQSHKVANPGCHASGAISLLAPLTASGLLKKDAPVSVYSLTGYTGGGKKMIADYEQEKTEAMEAPAPYALSLCHKHIPEIMKLCALESKPMFLPVVDDYPRGMLTSIMLDQSYFNTTVSREQILKVLHETYDGSLLVKVHDEVPAKLYGNEKAGRDSLDIYVSGNEDQFLLCALFDNLGKGACGAAIQNMNLMLGLEESAGLNL